MQIVDRCVVCGARLTEFVEGPETPLCEEHKGYVEVLEVHIIRVDMTELRAILHHLQRSSTSHSN